VTASTVEAWCHDNVFLLIEPIGTDLDDNVGYLVVLKAIEWIGCSMVVLATEARKVSVEDAISLDRERSDFEKTPEADRAIIIDLTGTSR